MDKNTDLDNVTASLSVAKGLANAHYVDPDMFEVEKHAVLFKSWAGVGFGKDIPSPGDCKPIEFLGVPLLLVRNRAGEVKVFQNTCRHRGMILVSEPRKIEGAIRCPYHSWCYNLNGELKATPHVGGPGQNTHTDIDPTTLGLVAFRSHIWNDVVFVNIDGTAPEFDVVHAHALNRWREFDKPMHHGGATSSFKLEVKSNWKLAVENYCESYHLPWVHPGLNSYSRLEDHYNIEEPGLYSGQGTLVYRQLVGESGETFPDFEGLGDAWDTGGEYLAIYPNVLLGVQRDHTFAIVLEPLSCSETKEHIEIYYAKACEQTPDLEDLRARNGELWKAVFEEDVFVVEGMQKGRHGVHFDGGRFSPAMDGPTHLFHHWVATQLKKASEPAQNG